MIIVDTSVWVDHFRQPLDQLARLIRMGQVGMHPYVIGELATGNFPDWMRAIADLRSFSGPLPVSEDDYYGFVFRHKLMGTGIGFVDIHLLATAMSRAECRLWSRDKKLLAQAERLGCALTTD